MYLEASTSLATNLVHRSSRVMLPQCQPSFKVDVENSEIGDDLSDAARSSHRQRTRFLDFRVAVFVNVRLYNNDIGTLRV